MISSCDCSILPSSSRITFSRGVKFLRNIFINLYACLVFPIVRPFPTSSHCCCIQCSLSCLAAFLPCLQRFLYCCDFPLEASFVCFSVRFSSANFNVSSDIQVFLAALLTGIVVPAVSLIASSIFLACASRSCTGSIFSIFAVRLVTIGFSYYLVFELVHIGSCTLMSLIIHLFESQPYVA